MSKESDNQEKDKKERLGFRRTWKNQFFMLRLLWKVAPKVVLCQLLLDILGGFGWFLQGTYLFSYTLNALQLGTPLRQMLWRVGGLLLIHMIIRFLRDAYSPYERWKKPQIEGKFQQMLQEKALAVELECFERPEFYDTYVKAMGEASDRAFRTLNVFGDILWCVVYVSSTVTFIATIQPLYLILTCLPFLFTLLLGKRKNKIIYRRDMKNKEIGRKKDYVRRTFYLVDFSKEMRLSQMYSVMLRQMGESVKELTEVVKKTGPSLMFFRLFFDFLYDIVVYSGSVLLVGYQTLISKTLLLGDAIVITNSIVNIAGNFDYLGGIFMKADENARYIENLRTFLDYEVKIPEDPDAPEAPDHQVLALEHLSFTYAGSEQPTLKDISLEIKAGEKIAIVGHNGAGKTTLVKLLLRLYDPTKGQITLNGTPIPTYRLSSYRNLFGSVFQDYQLFSVPVAENVLLKDNLTEAERQNVRDSIEQSGLTARIEALPQGIDTMVTKEFDKEGAAFSGGEAQKLAIARIFAKQPRIVILDEPSSALDPIAESEMYENMFEACQGKTVIFISHRLSSATMADRIYHFEHGEIIETGTHTELLARGGKYAQMWHKQAEKYQDGEVTA